MFNKLFIRTTCHVCRNTIEEGRWFCKTCGRSRGINGSWQFKKWEMLIISIGLSVFLGICFFTSGAILATFQSVAATQPSSLVVNQPINNNDLPHPTATKNPPNTKTPHKTSTPKSEDFTNYSCPDKSKIKLRVGLRAIVSLYDVNLRSSPIVPEVWDANIITMLSQGDKMLVIGGPKCAHEGTWWEVETENGYSGWIREMQPNKILLEPLD